MYYTEQEIMTQHEALQQTYGYMMTQRGNIEEFFDKYPCKKFNIIGCGSSYMLAKSGQRMFVSCPGTSVNAIAGGDYLTNSEYYREAFKNSIVITLSRSGKTTEILRGLKIMKEQTNCRVLSLSMLNDNDFIPYVDMNLIMGWSYDRSVCQTRTVTNLYLAMTMLYAFYQKDDELLGKLKLAIAQNEAYKEKYRPILKSVADREWDEAVILADGPLVGIGEEGALAFTEISMLRGSCFNMLDYRHGPIVLNGKRTLTIIMLQPGVDKSLQKDMVEEMKKRSGTVITVSQEDDIYSATAHVCIGGIHSYIACGIPFINVMQILAYEKAVIRGTNPDMPTGLDAYITLS